MKHCHSYLGHEFLSAIDRPGRYGGSLENRTRFLRDIVAGIRAEAPGLEIGVRVSAFDFRPFEPGPDGAGVPVAARQPYRYAFGADAATGLTVDLRETVGILHAVWSDLESSSSARRAAAPITIRTCSVRPRFRHRMVINRRKTRWWAWPGRSRRRRGSKLAIRG